MISSSLKPSRIQLIQLKSAIEKKENENSYSAYPAIQQSEVIFKSDQMYQAVSTALAVAPTDATVLITGESGTGKEVITNQIYQASKRFGKPFLKVNCAAIPDTLMESELFGYEPGAFTGASKSGKTGIFELANGGTLMLTKSAKCQFRCRRSCPCPAEPRDHQNRRSQSHPCRCPHY